jgi:hypothetical protein
MPSFFKRLLLGKELSNPYVNPYHQGHRAKVSAETHPTSPQALPSAETGTNPYVKHYVSHDAAGTDKALDSASRGAAQASIEQGQAGRVYASRPGGTVRGNLNESEEDYDDDSNQTPSPSRGRPYGKRRRKSKKRRRRKRKLRSNSHLMLREVHSLPRAR